MSLSRFGSEHVGQQAAHLVALGCRGKTRLAQRALRRKRGREGGLAGQALHEVRQRRCITHAEVATVVAPEAERAAVRQLLGELLGASP